MSYLVLARKWRPQTFDEIIGQKHITETLKNAISSGKTAHAFIFSGPRGVGKTSTARIVAKALNCDNGPTDKPCSKCPSCEEIAQGKSLDVIEIDAASHTGVNDVREIIENVKYLPSSGKNKIYIIDEAHMLSQSAFNALLKTLEEPPPHVLFILATTEVHKIPITILSRCQRYDYRKVSVDKIKSALITITEKENINIEEQALYIISQEADGSMRDALSLMDQLIATFGNNIKNDEAIKVLGILDRSLVKSEVKAIVDKSPKEAIEVLHQAIDKGISPKRFSEDVLRTLRYALIIKTCGTQAVSDLSEEDKNQLKEIFSKESTETLESIFKLMLEETENIQRSVYPQMALELTLIKLSTLSSVEPIDNIISKIESLSESFKTNKLSTSRLQEPHNNYASEKKDKDIDNNDPKSSETKPYLSTETKQNSNKEVNRQTTGDEILDFIQYVKTKKPVLAKRLEQANKISLENSTLVINCSSKSPEFNHLKKSDTKKILAEYLKEFFSKDIAVNIEETIDETNNTNDIKKEKEDRKKRIQKHPAVKDAVEVFGGKIVSTKPK